MLPQRRPLMAIKDTYKTTWTAILQILAGVPHLDLKLWRIARIEGGKAAVSRWELSADETVIKEMQYNKAPMHLWEKR